jgi:primosomal protein N' (replication factor Y)
MDTDSRFIDVAFPLPGEAIYTYRVPPGHAGVVSVGTRVLAPLRRQRHAGFVIQVRSTPARDDVRDILEVLDAEPPISREILELTRWVSEYYLCSWGEALKAALPGGTIPRERVFVHLKEPSVRGLIRAKSNTSPDEAAVLKALAPRRRMEARALGLAAGVRDLWPALSRLEREGYIELTRALCGPRVASLKTDIIRLGGANPPDESVLGELRRRNPAQASFLERLQDLGGRATRRDIPADPRVIRALERRGLIAIHREEIPRPAGGVRDWAEPIPSELTEAQNRALAAITAAQDSRLFQVFLLHGVTGSGKTEVYVRSVEVALQRGRCGLVLVPEISLIPQTVSRFRQRFGDRLIVYHSALSPGERYEAFRRIRAGEAQMVVGVRSAVFAPLPDLGVIVVDEEHETSYKQVEVAPRYHARDVAVMRGKMAGAVVILGTATPSLESYQNARQGKYRLQVLPLRIEGRPLPSVNLLDCRHQEQGRVLSSPLRQAMEAHFRAGGKTLLLLNRRGFATWGQCPDCGFSLKCPRCSISLILHHAQQRGGKPEGGQAILRCHYCGLRHRVPSLCPRCRSQRFVFRGAGTQKLEAEAREILPGAGLQRMDRDTTQRREAHWDILERFQSAGGSVLIGTQMIAKGLDIPQVSLVGVISADAGLNVPDFRSAEKTFQILSQVAGRAGRGAVPGEVLVQTYDPTHPALVAAGAHDYDGFFEREIRERKSLNYPPFSHLVLLVVSAPTEGEASGGAGRLRDLLEQEATRVRAEDIDLLGPAPAPLSRLKGRHRWQILLRSRRQRAMAAVVRAVLTQIGGRLWLGGCRIAVDVDPVEMT